MYRWTSYFLCNVQQFKSRLRDMRSKSFDACRDLATLKLEVNEGYNELVSTLNSQLNKFDFVQPDDVFKTLKEIQQEILEQLANEEVSDYEAYIQDEMDAIVENLITCRVCGLYSERDICEACSTKHFAD